MDYVPFLGEYPAVSPGKRPYPETRPRVTACCVCGSDYVLRVTTTGHAFCKTHAAAAWAEQAQIMATEYPDRRRSRHGASSRLDRRILRAE